MSKISDSQSTGLVRRRTLPPGAVWHDVEADDGWSLRTVCWPAERRDGLSILFMGGRADFIEKYAESYWHWRDQGIGLISFDWRGQGLSGRYPKGATGYFERWLQDLDMMIRFAHAQFQSPFATMAHSMGGHLMLRYLVARGEAATPVARAVILSPMVGILNGPELPLSLTSRLAIALGRGDRYPPGHGPYGKSQRSARRQALLTSDAERFADEDWWIAQCPDLALGGVTYRWLAEALGSCRALRAAGVPEAIRVPVSVLTGAGERLVDMRAAEKLTARIPGADWHVIPGAAHELLREQPALQVLVYDIIDAFVGADLSG